MSIKIPDFQKLLQLQFKSFLMIAMQKHNKLLKVNTYLVFTHISYVYGKYRYTKAFYVEFPHTIIQ